MRRMIHSLAWTIAGCGLLAGSAAFADSLRSHDDVRARVLATVGSEWADAERIRAALREDPDFSRLLEYFRQRALQSLRHSSLAEDAVQETFMKTWKGRPEIFLKDHDEVVRYLRGAARKNLLTLIRRSGLPGGRATATAEPSADLADQRSVDPLAEPAARELLERLQQRLGHAERQVLSLRLAGTRSTRALAQATGASRHEARRLEEKIAQEWRRMVGGSDGSAA